LRAEIAAYFKWPTYGHRFSRTTEHHSHVNRHLLCALVHVTWGPLLNFGTLQKFQKSKTFKNFSLKSVVFLCFWLCVYVVCLCVFVCMLLFGQNQPMGKIFFYSREKNMKNKFFCKKIWVCCTFSPRHLFLRQYFLNKFFNRILYLLQTSLEVYNMYHLVFLKIILNFLKNFRFIKIF
jgi:hypothetical protein